MKEYGITTSEAHYWLHVCHLDAMFYWYPRARMQQQLSRFDKCTIRSAIGHIVPIHPNLRSNGGIIHSVVPGFEFFAEWDWNSAESDKAVGKMAEACFAKFVREHQFFLPVKIKRFYESTEDQYKGKDFEVSLGRPTVDIEVKGDARGGVWGTGNLFVQTHETGHDYNGRRSHLSEHVDAQNST